MTTNVRGFGNPEHCPKHCQPDCQGGQPRVGYPSWTLHESLDGASWVSGWCPYCIGAQREQSAPASTPFSMYAPARVPFWLALEGISAMIASTIPANNRDALNEAQRLWPRMDKWARRRIATEVDAHRPVPVDGWAELLDTATSRVSRRVPVPRSGIYTTSDDPPQWSSVTVDGRDGQ